MSLGALAGVVLPTLAVGVLLGSYMAKKA